MTPHASRAYWVVAPGRGGLRDVEVPPSPPPEHGIVRALRSGVSPGTERLVGTGAVAAADSALMACPYMDGGFELPVKYGYALVGEVVVGSQRGRRVFVMHPHQEAALVADTDLVFLPDGVPSDRATLLPNLETALNGVWDGNLRPDERCAVVGAGPVGLLIAFVVQRTTGRPATIVEIDPDRASAAAKLPWVDTVIDPGESHGIADVAFHATGRGDGLQTALDALAFEGRVIDLSWYGNRPVTLDLGTAFHRGRKCIQASQVATVARSHRSGDARQRRTRAVLDLLLDRELDALIAPGTPFDELPALMEGVYADEPHHPHLLVTYD